MSPDGAPGELASASIAYGAAARRHGCALALAPPPPAAAAAGSACTSITSSEGMARCAYHRCSIHSRPGALEHETVEAEVQAPGGEGSR
jgi:hypothetical protein